MYQSISLTKLWAILASVVIMLLQGCGTTPIEQTYETEFDSQDYNNEEVSYHTVQRGETLSIIANIYGIDYKTLAALNNIYPPYTIYPDQRLEIGSDGFRSGEYDSEGMPVSIQPLPRSQVLDYKRTSARNKYSSRRNKSRYRKTSGFNKSRYRKTSGFKSQGNDYIVKRGDSLYHIAKRYGKNYRQLAAWNFISSPYQLDVGQRLRLTPPSQGTGQFYSSSMKKRSVPVKKRSVPVKKRSVPVKKGSVSSHIVQRGETLSIIAQRYGYALWEIARWNGLERPYYLSRGQRLRVAPWTTNRSRQQTTQSYRAKSGSGVYHTVVRGDTLYSISRHYSSTVSEVIQWNHLYPPYNLSVGQRLQVNPSNKWGKKKKRGKKDKRDTRQIKKTTPRHNTGYHTVVRGDTVSSISRIYGYSVSEIGDWNNLYQPYSLSVGQQLRVYPPSKVRLGYRKTTLTTSQRNTKSQRNTNAGKKVNSHIVAPGETLYSIAKRYGKTVSQIIRWNHLRSPYTLSVGQRLQFYQTKSRQRSYKKRSPTKSRQRSYKKRSSTTSRQRSYKKRSSRNYYLIKRGDTLKNVAAMYGVSVYDLSNWNGIGAPYTLYPGQRLLITSP